MTHIRQCQAVFLRELYAYFNSPIAYIYSVVFVLLTAGLFMTQFYLIGSADMRPFFGVLPIVLCVFLPAVTMRLWAEEKKGNTFELLLTFPMPTLHLVLGKFLASFLFYLVSLTGTLMIPLMLMIVGNPDPGPIWGGYWGALFMGAFFISVGIFISGLCRDQIVAFIVSMIVCFFFYLMGLDFMASLIDGWFPGVGNFLHIHFGMTRHFESFEKGVIDSKDVLYFLVMTVIFLVLNIFSIEDRLRSKAKLYFSMTVGVCLAISMVFNVLFMDLPLGRFDLTEDKLYTVTESTQKILKSLSAPVMVKLYISPPEKMPTAFKRLEQEVMDRLKELKIMAQGNLDYKVYRMEVTEEVRSGEEESQEDKLLRKGISPFQVQSIEEDEVGIKLIYSAIAIAFKEKAEEIIPQVTTRTLPNLEYELMSKIYRLTLEKRPKVSLVAPFTEKTLDPQMLAILRQLGQVPEQYRDDRFRIVEALLRYEDYDLNRVRLTREDPLLEDVDTLILLAPENLNERQLYEVNRFLHKGGHVLIAAQMYEHDYNQGRRGITITPREMEPGVNALLKDYGVTLSEEILMDEEHEVLSISGGSSLGPFAVSVPVKAPMHILVHQEGMNQEISITGRLSSLFYLWGSALELNKEKITQAQLKETVLFSSSDRSWSVSYRPEPLGRADLERSGSGYKGPYPLAVMLEGQFPDSFAGQERPPWPSAALPGEEGSPPPEEPEEPEGSLQPKPGKLIVMGCSKMFEEDFIQAGGALDLLINSVDAITLGGDLIHIRSHQPINRAIKSLSRMDKIWYRFMTVILVPIVVIFIGILRAIMRRKEKELYLKLLPATG